jgi:AhpD family alkylhydroperoxidase
MPLDDESGRRFDGPRLSPAGAGETSRLNAVLLRIIGLGAGGRAPNVFTTLARHRRLFPRWLRFAGALMPGGELPRPESELVILRVAENCGCDYERLHHEQLGRAAGLTAAEIEAVREGPEADGWSHRQQVLLRAVDELHAERTISDGLWRELRAIYTDEELIELCMLTGHYEMLAMTLNALAVQPDPEPAGPPPKLITRALELRRRRRAA